MSEMEKKEICTIEDHDTYSKDLEKTNIMESSGFSGYNESQDFRLVDIGDEESLDKSENEKNRNVLPVSLDNVDTTLGLTDTSVSVHQDIEKDNIAKAECAEEEIEEIEKNEKDEKDERNNDSGVVTSKSKQSDEEEEEEEGVIECTPPEAYSSSNNKKQMVSNATTTNLKRKAESFDEPPKKLLKTEAKEDVVISKKKESEDEESCHSFKSDDSHQEFSKSYSDRNVIIAETQDTGDENAETMIEKISTNEEKSKNEKHSELEVKIFEIDKNENFNDASILNEAVANNKEEEEEEFSDTTNAVQLKENRSSVMKENDSSTSPIKMGTIEKMQSDSNNTGGIKLIDTCIKDSKIRIEKGADNNNKNGIGLEEKGKEIAETSVSNEITNESHSSLNSTNLCKSRNSIELIYDRTAAHEIMKAKPKEIVEIDEDGEKIVLDSSQEDSDLKIEKKNLLDNTKSETIYKSCYESKSSSEYSFKSIENTKESTSLESTKSNKLMNGSSESKRCDTDSTASLQSDTFSDGPVILDKVVGSSLSTPVRNVNKQVKQAVVSVLSKDTSDHTDLLLSVSDNEPDVFIVDDKTKSNLTHGSSIAKAVVQVEKEIGIYVRMKCLLHVDEGTKEFLNKEITGVQCETVAPEATDRLTMIRQKNNDTSASLADISGNDNKDTSPGSVNSNPQLYQLNPSRLSFASTISSLSSASSGASLTAKLAIRDSTHFSLPKAPLPKHARKQIQDMHLLHDKQALDEAYERLSKEWQNSHLLATTILNLANTELSGIDTTCNVSNERIDDQLQKIRSSTPEVVNQELMQVQQVQMQTPKSTKKNKSVKRQRSKSLKSADGHHSTAAAAAAVAVGLVNQTESNNTPSRKKNKIEQQTDSGLTGTVDDSAKSLSQMITDELIGKDVFAKWSDNNYYPGTVTDKVKTKYKVNFYDGKNKILIEDFVIPIPALLKEGLSVYATSKNDDYGSCGIIVDTETVNNQVYYIVETDEGEKLQVQVKNIFLTSDQAQLLKEEISSENKSLPSTPKHLGQITLDNMVDGKRRSKRIATPSYLTPKIHTPSKNESEPSVSGIPSSSIMNKKNKKRSSESSDAISSDSNVSLKDEMFSIGIQPEIIGTPYEQTVKGPQNRIKSIKSRSNKKKVEDEETIAIFGPIPRTDSNLFKGMSFILTCAPVETIDRFQIDNKDYGSDPGTENEEDWVKKPFIRDRLTTQIVAGGGKVYTDFNEIPREEYKNTKLITNVPNSTAKTLLCLSVGIPAYNHNWIIRCCQEGKIVNPAEDELPAGWSLDKQSYVEMFQRPSNKPFTRIIVIIPVLESNKQFVTFWRQICENAGACVLLADKPDTMENYIDGTVILTNGSCPSWTVEKAAELQIPLLSATWIVQCLIEGQLCQYDSQPRYKYNYNKKN